MKKINSIKKDFFALCQIKIHDINYLVGGGEKGNLNFLNLSSSDDKFIKDKANKNPNTVKIFNLKTKNQIAILTNEQNVLIYEYYMHENKIQLECKDTIIGFNDEIIDLKFQKYSKSKICQNELIVMATNSSIIKYILLKNIILFLS